MPQFDLSLVLLLQRPSCLRRSADLLLGSASYSPEAPELQIRKMADLCFLVQHYEMAFSCYHTAKKDFLSDQAMIYAAGALVRPSS